MNTLVQDGAKEAGIGGVAASRRTRRTGSTAHAGVSRRYTGRGAVLSGLLLTIRASGRRRRTAVLVLPLRLLAVLRGLLAILPRLLLTVLPRLLLTVLPRLLTVLTGLLTVLTGLLAISLLLRLTVLSRLLSVRLLPGLLLAV